LVVETSQQTRTPTELNLDKILMLCQEQDNQS